MKASDLQQALSGFKTVAVISGPLTVRVHEALDVILAHTKHRYFISVDFKFRQSDALNIGKSGWLGRSKSEATKDANLLAHNLSVCYNTMKAAEQSALNHDTFTNRYTVKVQTERFDKLASKYCCEFEHNPNLVSVQ